jgi:hypothetical protein
MFPCGAGTTCPVAEERTGCGSGGLDRSSVCEEDCMLSSTPTERRARRGKKLAATTSCMARHLLTAVACTATCHDGVAECVH